MEYTNMEQKGDIILRKGEECGDFTQNQVKKNTFNRSTIPDPIRLLDNSLSLEHGTSWPLEEALEKTCGNILDAVQLETENPNLRNHGIHLEQYGMYFNPANVGRESSNLFENCHNKSPFTGEDQLFHTNEGYLLNYEPPALLNAEQVHFNLAEISKENGGVQKEIYALIPQSSTNVKDKCETSHLYFPPQTTYEKDIQPQLHLSAERFQNWTIIFPQKFLTNTPEMIILNPLQTCKSIRDQQSLRNVLNLDLEHNETSSLIINNIPQYQRKNNANRRKQTLEAIPGSEYFSIDLQSNENTHSSQFEQMISYVPTKINNELYPETELPELEEIFKRKRKITDTFDRGCPSPPKKKQYLFPISKQNSFQDLPKSSMEVSVSIRRRRLNVHPENMESKYNSDVDYPDYNVVSSELAKDIQKNDILKCRNCNKFFKSSRSLTIHSRGCHNRMHNKSSRQEGTKSEIISSTIL